MDDKKNLIQALYQLIGNKVYLKNIEDLLETIELTPSEKQSFRYLAQDLRSIYHQENSNKRKFGLI